MKVLPQYKRVARVAKSSVQESLRVVFLRNGVLFASNGYMMAATRFPSSIIMITQMTHYKNLLKDELSGDLWTQCEGSFLSAADQMWDGILKTTLHTPSKGSTINTKYLLGAIDPKSESFTVEVDLASRASPVVVVCSGVKSIIMPIFCDNDSLDEWSIGQYKE